jgi:type IV secretory pathway TraG/TraD family ATPase VirD4
MSRGAGVRFVLAQQSLAAGELALGKPAAKVMAANLNTKIWCRIADDDDSARVATEGVGLCTVHLPETGVGISYGGVGGLSGSSRRSLTAKDVPLIRSQWLTALPRGEAFVRMKGEIWKLRVPLLDPVDAQTLDTLGLTALWRGLARTEAEEIHDDARHI